MAPFARDPALDIIRGYAIIVITVNHYSGFCSALGYNGPRIPTPTNYGYSSAAEIFFFVSGYLIGFIHARNDRPFDIRKSGAILLSRAMQLWIMNAFLFMTIMSLTTFFAPEDVSSIIGGSYPLPNPTQAIANFMRLGVHPPLLGILQFYVFFVLVAIPLLWLTVWNWKLSAALVVLLYFLTFIAPELTLPGGRVGRRNHWEFHPLGWQAIFFGGLILGHLRIMDQLKTRVEKNSGFSPYFIFSVVALAVFSMVWLADSLTSFDLPMTNKNLLRPMRVLHFGVFVLFLVTMLYQFQSITYSRVGVALSWIGKQSLNMFAFSVVLSYIMALLWAEKNWSVLGYFGLGILSVALLFIAERVLRVISSLRKKDASNQRDA